MWCRAGFERNGKPPGGGASRWEGLACKGAVGVERPGVQTPVGRLTAYWLRVSLTAPGVPPTVRLERQLELKLGSQSMQVRERL